MKASIEVPTDQRVVTIDITQKVESAIEPSVSDGICHVYVPHTTTGVFVNEAESNLLEDVREFVSSVVPEDAGYAHDSIDDNADAHLRAILLGSSATVPIAEGHLDLGTWQRILLFEGDGPRDRKVEITVLGE